MPEVEIREFLRLALARRKSPPEADAYRGSPRICLGISTPDLRVFARTLIVSHKAELTPDAAISLLDKLHVGETLEEVLLAGMLLARLPDVRASMPLDTFGDWLGGLNGWLEVDATCQSTFSPAEIYARWDEWAVFLRALNADHTIAKRRASIVLLIRTVRESDDPRGITFALELVGGLKSERHKLIVKAVSWVLREAAKRHSAAVSAYLDANVDSLHSSVVREVRTKVATGKKH